MLREWPAFHALAKTFAEGPVCLRIAGLTGAARALAVAELVQAHPRPAVVLVESVPDAHRWTQDLKFFGAPAFEFPEPEPRLWRGGRQREADAERAVICWRLAANEPVVVVVTPAALDAELAAPPEFAARTLRLAVGDSLDREPLLAALERAGYERVDTVVEVGQWSLRGGIVDVFSPSLVSPARVEFFGDEIEAMRLFDPSSQRSRAPLDELLVLPLPTQGDGARLARLTDYVPVAAPIVVDVPRVLDATREDAPGSPPLRERLSGRQLVELSLVAGTSSAFAGPLPEAVEVTLETQAVPQFGGRFAQLAGELGRWRGEGFRIRLVASDARQVEHLRQILREHELEALPATTLDGDTPLALVVGDVSAGFSIPALGVIVLTEGEIFGARRRLLRRPKYQRGAALTAFTDLAVGDVVVHEDHGLGRYLGLKTMTVGDRDGDFLVLEYAEGNQLYLPVERLDLVSKYLGADASAVRLDRLGGAAWPRVKESVRASLREMAEELLRLYAQRAVAEGHACSPDTPWQREFEAAFRFEETPDQLRAIEEVKRDMESPRPMDRLVAGDVGYGKTEVALRASVDVLALTATPIPRTLYMSLSGVRDMSVIETPPLDRLPVETIIRRFSTAVIKEALERELERGGQVFFVHNRVQSLPSVARFIQALVPDARVRMAHGQMKERELEATMVKFVSGQADVLASTAIVESGLDIPATNTIVVNRADRFGLAQLYQLRGRVGRERQQAYACLLVPADGRVDEQAQRRLRALQEFTELGSGFKLALRDLEIRGAGNLLGAAQHGHIAAVGFDLYAKLLAEAVRELKGEPTAAAVEPVISVAVEGFLPDDYVPEVNQRLAFYKRLASAVSDAEVDDLRAELLDRFGPPPTEAEQLFDVVHLRVAARSLGVEKLEAGEGVALVTFAPGTPLDPRRLVRAIEGSRGRLKMKREFTIEAVVERGEWARVRASLLRLLEGLGRP